MTESQINFWNAKVNEWTLQDEDKNNFFTRRLHFISEFITNHVPKCRSLDVGCAGGFLVEILQRAGYDANGCDTADGMVKLAQSRLARIFDDASARIRVSTPDNIPFNPDFGLVTAIGVFVYVLDHDVFLQDLSGKLKPGGFICTHRTKNISTFSLKHALASLKRGNLRSALNLIRTGTWNGKGDYLDMTKEKQCRSATSFDRLLDRHGFEKVASFGMFAHDRFDKSPLSRKWLGMLLVRYHGWSYIAIYQKRA